MKINLNMLPYKINEEVTIPESFYKNTDIKKIAKLKVEGIIKYNSADEVEANLNVKGSMTLVDAITNEPIEYPLNIEIAENIEEFNEDLTKNYEKNQNTLDIIEFLWENIVLEVPIRITNEAGVQKNGDGWELNGKSNAENIDPRFEKLSELFKGGE